MLKVAVALGAVLMASSAQAAYLSSTGPVTFLAVAPASVASGALEGADIKVFDEQLGVAAPAGITGVTAGSIVDSTFIHFDPVGLAGMVGPASITFDKKIVAVLATSAALDATDASLGLGGTTYPTGTAFRGTEVTDLFSINGNSITLDITKLAVGTVVDQLRVVTAAVPEPTSFGLFGLGFAGLTGLGFRRRKTVA